MGRYYAIFSKVYWCLILNHRPPPPRRNKDMEIICESAGRAGAVDSCLQRGMAGIEKSGQRTFEKFAEHWFTSLKRLEDRMCIFYIILN